MDIPSVGRSRGVFEIFVPGLFLFVNLVVFVYLLPFGDQHVRDVIAGGASDIGLTLFVAIPFGYLLGMILRLGKADVPDNLSAWWLRLRKKNRNGWSSDRFPYIGWLGTVCRKRLPPVAHEFYKVVWEGRGRDGKANKQFFNFCKVVVCSADSNTASEVNMAEAQSRYIAETFYGLVVSSGLASVSLVFDLSGPKTAYAYLILALLLYAVAIWEVLRSYRQLRIKEVEVVFAATFRHRKLFLERLSPETDNGQVIRKDAT